VRCPRNEDDRRIRWEPRARLSDQAIDFFQADSLKTRRQFSTELLERVSTRVGGTPLTEFALLPNNTDRE